MRKLYGLLAIAALTCMSMCALAQPTAPPHPVACDVTYTLDTTVMVDGAEHDSAVAPLKLSGVPWDDVVDNSAKGLKVVNFMRSVGEVKGAPYIMETSEVRACDGGPPQVNKVTSLRVEGISLNASNRIGDFAADQMALIRERYKARARQGLKLGWDHRRAQHTRRNDLNQHIVQ